jgi:hypothetical protein
LTTPFGNNNEEDFIMSCNRLQTRGTGFVFEFLEEKLSLSSMLGSGTTIVYSDPTAPPEPLPGPYPGEGSPIGYPTPVPGGPVGPGAF